MYLGDVFMLELRMLLLTIISACFCVYVLWCYDFVCSAVCFCI